MQFLEYAIIGTDTFPYPLVKSPLFTKESLVTKDSVVYATIGIADF